MLDTKLSQLRKANQRLHKSVDLKLDDHELLKQMFAYLEHKRLNPYDLETVRADVLGMAQEAKKRKQPLRELIGDDRAFCDGLLANCNKKSFNLILCEWLALLFLVIFVSYAFFCGGLNPLFGDPRPAVVTEDIMYDNGFLWLVYFILCTQIIPLPYKFFKHKDVLFLLVCISWLVLRVSVFKASPDLVRAIIFSVSGWANILLLFFFGLGYPGLRYTADILAYRQSSFGGKG